MLHVPPILWSLIWQRLLRETLYSAVSGIVGSIAFKNPRASLKKWCLFCCFLYVAPLFRWIPTPSSSGYSFVLKRELSGSSETDASVKKLQCVGCTVFGVWTGVSLVDDILLQHFKCGLQQKAVPDAMLVFKISQWNKFCFSAVFFSFHQLKFASHVLTAQFCIWHMYRVMQEGRSVVGEMVVSGIVRKQIHTCMCLIVNSDRERAVGSTNYKKRCEWYLRDFLSRGALAQLGLWLPHAWGY